MKVLGIAAWLLLAGCETEQKEQTFEEGLRVYCDKCQDKNGFCTDGFTGYKEGITNKDVLDLIDEIEKQEYREDKEQKLEVFLSKTTIVKCDVSKNYFQSKSRMIEEVEKSLKEQKELLDLIKQKRDKK
jgi:hypothetical protein